MLLRRSRSMRFAQLRHPARLQRLGAIIRAHAGAMEQDRARRGAQRHQIAIVGHVDHRIDHLLRALER
jgi:hypothetical protein